MDFFARQERARRRTKWLVIYFVAAVAAIIVSVYALMMLVCGYVQLKTGHFHHGYSDNYYATDSGGPGWWNPTIFLYSTAGVLLIVLGGSAYKTSELAAGGGVVAQLMGGRRVTQDTQDPDERKLLNVVEEMAIASGVPMPEVYLLPEERGINAFAAGHAPGDAAIGVTQGCVQLLTRDELQGVIGHEFSHILNGDMRLNLRLMGTIFGLFCLATIGRVLLSLRSSNSRDRNPLPLVGLVLLVLGAVGVFFGRLIQAAVCREREFLADASSVQFTRNPAGLSGALQKIGGCSCGSRMTSEHAPDVCHLFFGNGLGEAMFGAMATHPPLRERIMAIDPAWNGRYVAVELADPHRVDPPKAAPHPPPFPPLPPGVNALPGAVVAAAVLGDNSFPAGGNYQNVLADVGTPTPAHLAYAGKMFEQLPEGLKTAVRNPLGATAFVYAVLLTKEEPLRAQQLAEIGRRAGSGVAEQTSMLAGQLSVQACSARLPLVNLAIGSMRDLTPEQYQAFTDTLEWLVASDGKIELFEFVVQRAVRRHLTPRFTRTRPPVAEYYSIKGLAPDCAVVLSALADVGSRDPVEMARAFAAGVPHLRLPDGVALAQLGLDQCGLAQIGEALNRLAMAAPQIKRNLLAAASAVVGADGVITQEEAELLRAVADSLDCPTPPALGN